MKVVQKRIRRQFSPMSVIPYIQVLGSSQTQVFRAASQSYEPNRTLTPTVIRPEVSVYDPDLVFENGTANRKLGYIKWYVNGVDVTTTDDYLNGLYAIDLSDSIMRGTLSVKKNVSPETRVKLRFEAILPDTRTGQNLTVSIDNILLTTQDVAPDKWTVELNCPTEVLVNPISMTEQLVITPNLFRGTDLIPLASNGISFMLYSMNGTNRVPVTTYELISIVQGVVTLDLRLIQKKDYLLSVIWNNSIEIAYVQFSVMRYYPHVKAEMVDYGDILPNQQVIYAMALVHSPTGVVADPGKYYTIEWHTVSPYGDVTHNQGELAEIDVNRSGIGTGGVDIYYTIDEKEAMKVGTDSAGEVYTVDNEPIIFN